MTRVIGSFLLLITTPVSFTMAYPNYLATFNTRYGTAQTVLNNCRLCHGSSTAVLNYYGQSLLDGLGTHPLIDSALATIEPLDSDGDGVINIYEIMGRSFPGDASSTTPVENLTWGKLKHNFE
jgi:hypothetical protein